ncbi:HNH endonuclease [Arthrobacter sp. KNU-44]|uniref:HNH endonuclease n=1 Tax=Arthrobacter sp. KNU-44 TaxID=3450744 RepID=UPI003F426706
MLDYETSRTPPSAEVDHIVAHANGGQDALDNVAVCCRRCNQSKGNRTAPKTQSVLAAKPLKTSRRW